MRQNPSEHAIAIGFALGTCIAILPTPGFGMLLGFVFTLVFRGVNKVAVFGAFAFWNYLTVAPIYMLSYKIGNMMFADTPVVKYEVELLNQVYSFSQRFLAGNVMLAFVIASASYVVIRYAVRMYRKS